MSASVPYTSDPRQPAVLIVPLSTDDDGGTDGGAIMSFGDGDNDNDDEEEHVPFVPRGVRRSDGGGTDRASGPSPVGASTMGKGRDKAISSPASSPHSLASDDNSILTTGTAAPHGNKNSMQQQPLSPPQLAASQRGYSANSGILTDICCRLVGPSRRLRPRHVAAGCLALLMIGMLVQQQNRHHREALHFHRSRQKAKNHASSSSSSFDVNGPPVPLSGADTIETLLEKEKREAELHHKDRQSNRIGTSNPAKPSYPVIKEDGERTGSASRLYASSSSSSGAPLPGSAAGTTTNTMHAAEALLCRESVVNFVINATDVKDECEGLKKAFDKTCSSSSNNNNGDMDEDSTSHHVHRHRRQQQDRRARTLAEKTRRKDRAFLFLYRHWAWIRWAYRASESYAKSLWEPPEARSCPSRLGFFFSEDAVADAYQDGYTSKLVERGWDELVFHPLLRQWSIQQQQEDELLLDAHFDGSADFDPDELPLNDRRLSAAVAETNGQKNETLKSPKQKQQQQQNFPLSLDLPTQNEHVSDKMVSETLLLSQGDTIIEKAHNESVMKKMKQQEAAHDAQASAKAVADTNAAVAAVLNDPTSIEARTCCASILSVYHENCSTDDNEQFSDSKLLLMLFVMAVCGIVKSLIRHYKVLWLPEAAGCILVGVLSGYVLMYFPHHDISFDGNWFLRIMVPPIVFEAALSIDKRSFNRHIVPIVIFSVVGTLMATVVTAFVVHRGTTALSRYCTPIPTVEALTFGALISSIDPIAVLSVLSNMGMTDTDTIYVLIFGESLLNDGVSIVLFQTLVHFLDDSLVIDAAAVYAAAVHFLVVAIGSLLIGVASGMMSTVYYWLFHGCQTPLVEVLMFMCWAMLPYYVCDGIEWSGIVAAVANGFVMDLYIRGQAGASDDPPLSDDSEDYTIRSNSDGPPSIRERSRRRIFSQQGHLSAEARQHIGFVTEILATALETAIFAYLGIFLFSHRYHWNVLHTVIAIFACCVSRAIMIPSLSLVANSVTRFQQSRAAACRYYAPGGGGGGKKSTPTAAYAQPPPSGPPGVLIDKRMQVVLWFAGLRGAMSFALVEHVPLYDSVSGEGTPFKPELKAMTSASILFTVFVLGGYTYYMMEYLGLAPQTGGVAGHHHHRSRGGGGPNGFHGTYELASLIAKVDSGDEAFEPSSRKGEVAQGGSGANGVITNSGRQLAFRRQRQAGAGPGGGGLSDATSPSHADD